MRSVRQSLASSTAERSRLPWCFSSLASKRSNRVKASAVAPAKPARMRSWYLAGGLLDDDVAQCDLAVAPHRHALAATGADDGRAVKRFHFLEMRSPWALSMAPATAAAQA
jgi:hypothetical protein